MYGLLNRAIEELVTQRAGRRAWDTVCERVGVPSVGFASIRAYPDELTFALVEATSQVLRCSNREVLRALGRSWIPFTVKEGFGSLLSTGGHDLRDFLLHLDSLHARLGLTMPGLVPPSFVVEERPEDVLHVHYYSQREGLAPLMVGLLEGLGRLFDAPIQVSQVRERESAGDCDIFAVVPGKRETPV